MRPWAIALAATALVAGAVVAAPDRTSVTSPPLDRQGATETATAGSVPGSTPSGNAARGEDGSKARPSFLGVAGAPFADGRVLAVPEDSAGSPAVRAAARGLGGGVVEVLGRGRVHEVRVPESMPVEQAVRRLERAPGIRFAEPDYIVRPTTTEPNDPDYPRLWGLQNAGQTGGKAGADINAAGAWTVTTGTAGAPIAVVDTGMDIRHPDLQGNLWTNPGEIAGNGVDDDRNGYVDDVNGWDFYHGDRTVFDGREDDHGTHVAGTIAAVGGNGRGVTGVNWRARIMPLKFLGPDGGLTSDAIKALDYAVAKGARVSNHSWGGGGHSKALSEAITRAGQAGHLLFAAAGNGGTDGVGDDIDVSPTYPAAYPHDNIITVAASDHTDALARFSNFGRTGVDLAAPGTSILSTLTGGAYGTYNGTSMATPHVTGAAGLLLAAEPSLTAAAVRQRLLSTVDAVPALATATATGGRLDVGSALGAQVAAATSLTATATPATVVIGRAASVSGTLTEGSDPLPGVPVALEARPVGQSTWSRVDSAATDSTGAVSFTGLRPGEHTDYRLAHDPGSGSRAVSTVRRVNVRVAVSLAAGASEMLRGRTRAIRGAVRPAHDGTVRMVIRRNGTVIRRATLSLTDSRFRLAFTPTSTGRYTFVVRRAADVDHLGASSPLRTVRVTG